MRPGDPAILIRYDEIALKGRNRSWFEQRLVNHIRQLLGSVPVEKEYGRIYLDRPSSGAIERQLSRVFGLKSFSPVIVVETDFPKIQDQVLSEARSVLSHQSGQSFKIQVHRNDKDFSLNSMEMERELGSLVGQEFPEWKVDLKKPDQIIGVEVRKELSFVWSKKIPGPGGLPVGSNSKVLTLMSGGLDSPVAALSMLKRGVHSAFIHFNGAPYVGEEALVKVEDLLRVIQQFSPFEQVLHVVPFGELQKKVALQTNPKIRTVLYRRLMMRIASQVAKRINALALVTGDSIGQVASQTVTNMSVVEEAAEVPVFRPLLSFDKTEIIEKAKEWGTYEVAVRPAEDCCTLFSDRHPATKANMEWVREEEEKLDICEWVEQVSKGIVRRVI